MAGKLQIARGLSLSHHPFQSGFIAGKLAFLHGIDNFFIHVGAVNLMAAAGKGSRIRQSKDPRTYYTNDQFALLQNKHCSLQQYLVLYKWYT